jgi:hypothetical protein
VRDVLILLLVIGLAAVILVLKWNELRIQAWASSKATKFDQVHPLVSAVLVSLLFASTGAVSALYAVHILQTQSSGVLELAAACGILIGGGGATIWAYAFAKEFDVSVWIGRLLMLLTVTTFLGLLGFLSGIAFLQVLCGSMLATRLLPQAVFALLQAREDVRHPETRSQRVLRAMTMGSRRAEHR